jgi:hypothetical protein
MMIDQATPELEQLAQAADEQSRGRPGNALHLLLSLSRSLQEGVGGAQEIVQDRLDALAQGGTEPEHPAPQRQNAQPLQHHPSPRKDMATHDQSSRP